MVGPETVFVGAYASVGAGAAPVESVDGFVVVSAADGVGDAELDEESDPDLLEARTAHVTDSAKSASVTAVSEGRSDLFSIVRFNMVERSPREAFTPLRNGAREGPQEH